MANKKIKMNEKNADGTFNILHPETTIEQVIDPMTGKSISEHFTDVTKKHIEIVDELPSNLEGKSIFFKKQDGASNAPGKPTIQDLSDKLISFAGETDEISVNAKSKGLIPNNTDIDNKQVIESLFSSNTINTITIPIGTYNTSRAQASIKNKVIKGVRGKTILQTSGTELLFLLDSENVVFEDITFSALSTNEYNGVITANGSSLKNITFRRCKFTTNGSNGIKFVNESTKTSEFIMFDDCEFENIGRMGVEFQNHNETGGLISRYSNITFLNCTFNNIGTKGANGMAISMSGFGENIKVEGCYFGNCNDVGIEIIGTNYFNIDKCIFIGTNKAYAPISVANFRPNKHIIITNNKSYGTLGRLYFDNGTNIVISDNVFYGVSALYTRNVVRSKINNNIIHTRTGDGIFLDNSAENDITDNTVDNTIAPSNFSVIRFFGANSKSNKAYNNRLHKASGGNFIANSDGATGNFIGENIQNNEKITGGVFAGYVNNILVGAATTDGASSISIKFTPSTYWIPYNLEVTCIGVQNSNGNLFSTKVNVHGAFLSDINSTVTVVVPSANATITATKTATDTIKLTCTHTNTSINMTHRWLVNGFCYQPFVLV